MSLDDRRETLSPMLAFCLLPAMYLLKAQADNYLLFCLGAVLSLLPEGVLLVMIHSAFGKKGETPAAIKTPLLIIIGIFFGTMSVFTVLKFARINEYFSQQYIGSTLVIALVLLSGLYIASLSDGAAERLSSAVLLITLSMYIITVLMAVKNGDVSNLHISSASPFDDVKGGFFAGALIFEPDIWFWLLCLTHKRGLRWGRFLALKGALLLLFTVPVIYVLGAHTRFSRLPSYDLSAYSKSVIIERFNGLFMMLITLSAIIKTALEMHALRRCAETLLIRKAALNEKA